MRITIVTTSLSLGGAEKILSSLANWWARNGATVTFITLSSDGKDYFKLDSRINRLGLAITRDPGRRARPIADNFLRAKRLREAIKRSNPDVVLSFIHITNVLTLIATRGLGVPVIVSERSALTKGVVGLGWRCLRRWTYRWADAVVVQTEGARSWAARFLAESRLRVIPNPVWPPSGVGQKRGPFEASNAAGLVVGAGRLVPVKQFDLLIRVFAKVRPMHPGWRLVIYGEGPLRASLEQLCVAEGLQGMASLPGATADLCGALRAADLFVMCSKTEGFPNALCEAMSCGLAVISTDCPSGPRDIIRQRVDGILVEPDREDLLAKAMDDLMGDRDRRVRLGKRALEIVERFSVLEVFGKWDSVVAQLSTGGKAK